MTTVEEALALAADVDGWMTEDQGRRLYDAAAALPRRAGGSSRSAASAAARRSCWRPPAPAGVEVVAIDPHAGNDRGPGEIDGYAAEAASDRDAFRANLERAGVADRVRHVPLFSDAAHAEVTDPIDVLYIDGAHRYAPARADIRVVGPPRRRRRHVADPRLVLVGRRHAGDPARARAGAAVPLRRPVAVADRVPRRPPGQRRRARRATRAVQLAQLPWFARNLGLKVALTLGYGTLARRLGRPVPEWPY